MESYRAKSNSIEIKNKRDNLRLYVEMADEVISGARIYQGDISESINKLIDDPDVKLSREEKKELVNKYVGTLALSEASNCIRQAERIKELDSVQYTYWRAEAERRINNLEKGETRPELLLRLRRELNKLP